MLLSIIPHICRGVEHECDRIEDSEQGKLCAFENIRIVNDSTVFHISKASSQEVEAAQFRNSTLSRVPMELFRVFPRLKHIDVDATGLKELNLADFVNANELQYFLASFNQIERISARTFAACEKLEYIVMSHNSITQIEERAFDGLVSLEAIFLDNNQLTSLPENLLNSAFNLQFLSISNNKLTQLPDELLINCEKLLALNYANNLLTSFNEKQFEKLQKLEHLRLDHNRLNALNLSSCRSVEVIIDNNKLQQLELHSSTRYVSAIGNPLKRIILHEHYGSRHYNFSFDLVNEIVFFVAEHCCTAESLENFQDLIHSFGDLAKKNLTAVHDWQCKLEQTVAYWNEANERVINDVCKRIETIQSNLSEVESTEPTLELMTMATTESQPEIELLSTAPESSELTTTTEPGLWKSMKSRMSGWKTKAKNKWSNVVG